MNINQEERFFEKMVSFSPDLFCCLSQSGTILYVSEVACKNITGYDSNELINRSLTDFLYSNENPNSLQLTQNIVQELKSKNFENCFIHKNGQAVSLSWSAQWLEADKVYICVAREATEQKLIKQKLKEEKELQQAMVENVSDTIGLLDKDGNYLYISGSIQRTLGYEPEEVIGKNAFDQVHPEDLLKVRECWAELEFKERTQISDYRFQKADGTWVWFETTVSNQLHNPAIKAMVVNARDITERKISSFQLIESEQRYRSLFDNNLNMILMESKDGTILDVNPAGVAFMKRPKHEIVNHHFSEFLPPAAAAICSKHMEDALNGKTYRFDLEIDYDNYDSKKIIDVLKIPIHVNNEIIGVHSIVKDITNITQYHNKVKVQAQKLSTIFESITDGFFTLDKKWRFTYINKEAESLLQLKREKHIGKHIFDIFPEENGKELHTKALQAQETSKPIHFTSYLKRLDIWLWVKVFPSSEGLSVYFEDITEKILSRRELEKLSLVASKTNNSVLLVDKELRIEWVNDGFTKLMGYSLEEAVGKKISELLHNSKTDKMVFKKLEPKLINGEPISFEILNLKKSGQEVWLSVEMNAVFNDQGEISRFIIVQTDINALKNSELELLKLAKDLYKQNSDLQQFTYIVSHNLRAPVANALGYANLLPRVNKNSEVYNLTLTNLKTSILRLDTVLKDLNLILSIRDNKDTIEKEKVDIKLKAQQAIASLQESLESCGGEVNLSINDETFLRGNSAYYYSIFYNLLSNAIKYRSPERALKIQIKSYGSTNQGTIISFADNGLGFDVQKVGGNLFKLYKRFHTTTAEGRGIGLFLVKSHVEAMGGHIEVSSVVNRGTKFLIYFK